MTQLVDYISSKEEDYLAVFKKMIELESPTYRKDKVDQLVDFIEGYLTEQGVQVKRVKDSKFGDHLVGEWGEGEEQIMLLGHIDTVWEVGTIDDIPFNVDENGRITGPGTYDMKGGIFQGLYAIKVMNDLNLKSKYKIIFIINTDEEVGTPSSRKVIEEYAKKCKYVLCAEPSNYPDGVVKTSRKGSARYELEITGIAAHSGADPYDGVSAIHEFAHQVVYLESLADKEKGTTVNVGTVKGGTRPNVVAPNLHAEIDVRVSVMKEAERIMPLIENLKPVNPRAKVKITGELNRYPMERSPQGIDLFNRIKDIAKQEQGFDLSETPSGGGSDANITAALGVPSICGMGVVGSGAHSVDEHCLLEYIPQRIALLINIFMKI